jgi:hypothetical protein
LHPALAEAGEQAIDVLDACARHRFRRFLIGADPQVLFHRQLRKDLAPFRDAGNARGNHLVGREPRGLFAVEHHTAGARWRQAEDRTDERGLAGAVRAEQAGDAAGLDRKRDALQHVRLVVGGGDVQDLETARHHATPR